MAPILPSAAQMNSVWVIFMSPFGGFILGRGGGGGYGTVAAQGRLGLP